MNEREQAVAQAEGLLRAERWLRAEAVYDPMLPWPRCPYCREPARSRAEVYDGMHRCVPGSVDPTGVCDQCDAVGVPCVLAGQARDYESASAWLCKPCVAANLGRLA